MTDDRIIKFLAIICSVGGLGCAFNVSLSIIRSHKALNLKKNVCIIIPHHIYANLVGLGGCSFVARRLLSTSGNYLHGGIHTINSLPVNANCGSVWMVSNVILCFDTLSCASHKPVLPIGNSQSSQRIITQTKSLSRVTAIICGALK